MDSELLTIRVCGAVTVSTGDTAPTLVRGRQPQTVLCLLALEGRQVHHEAIADVLWGEQLGAHWAGALRGILTKLRRTFADAGIDAERLRATNGLVWLDPPVRTEIDLAVEVVGAAEDDPSAAATHVETLLALAADLRRPFLTHDESDWATGQRYRIAAVRDRVDAAVLVGLRRAGRFEEAIGAARDRIAAERTDELAHLALVDLLVEHGPPASAAEAFRDLESMLDADRGRAPDPALRDRVFAARPRRTSLDLGPHTDHHPHADEAFVGRGAELDLIGRCWARVVASGHPELVLIEGPSGMGKTRLADRAAGLLSEAQVLWGRSRRGGDRSFGPIADALADAFRRNPDLARDVVADEPGIGLLLPEQHVGRDGPSLRGTDAGNVREIALGAARDVVRRIVVQPTVLVIDDLQWTGADGLAVLETILTDLDGPLLVLATTRSEHEAVADHLSMLQRSIAVTTIALGALSIDELTALCRTAGDPSAAPAVVDAVHRRTGGIPFFASELVRDALRRGDGLDTSHVPESVADWLDRYVRTLAPAHRLVLEAVAVFSEDGDLAGIEAVADGDEMAVAEALDALAEHGLVSISSRGDVHIPHDLTESSVYRTIGAARRALLHRKVGDHLQAVGARPELQAHHWGLAGPTRADQALDAHLEAGRSALRRGAWDAASTHFARVQERTEDPPRSVSALVGLGTAQLHQNHHRDARETLEEAIRLANHHGLDLAVAEATLVLVGRAGRGAALDDDVAQTEWLRAAHRLLLVNDGTPLDQRSGLVLSRIERELALSLLFSGTTEERAELLQRSAARIRDAEEVEPDDLAATLLGLRMIKLSAPEMVSRIDDIDEVLALPHAQLSAEVLIPAHTYRHEDLLRLGRREAAAADLLEARRLADRHHHAYWSWAVRTWEGLTLVFDGDLDGAEAAATDAMAHRPGVMEAVACHQVNLVMIRLLQGRADEPLPVLAAAADLFPQIPTYRAVLALTASEAGDVARAEAIVDEFARTEFTLLPEDTNRFLGLGVLAHAAADVGHQDAARCLLDLLGPYAGLHVLINCYGGGGAFWGPTTWALARLAEVAGRPADEVTDLWRRAVADVASSPVLAARVTAGAAAAGVAD